MAEPEGEMVFGSLQEELEYWKEKALEWRRSLDEVRAEFAEFQESSGELEGELEAQLDQVEKTNKDLLHRVSRLEDENESLKAFERNAILENELDEKQRQAEMCQRLKDEVKELRSELNRKHHRTASDEGVEQPYDHAPQEEPASSAAPSTPRITASSSHPPTPSNPTSSPSPLIHQHINSTAEPGTPRTAFTGIQNYTPSTRISALNMVGDLLRKVGALESRLASCRTHISTKDGRRDNSPATENTKVKRIHVQQNKYNGDPTTTVGFTKVTV